MQATGTLCYDADFTPFGGEKTQINSCAENYKFEGKERDTETQNDDFGARYYSWRLGRWLSSDWSAVPVAVPYANLNNPQTLNLYSMASDDPETFADLDGHWITPAWWQHMFDAGYSNAGQQTQASGQAQTKKAQNNTTGRQPDGSYKAPTGPGSEIAKINDPNGPPSQLIGNGQCVTATSHFSGVTGDTSQWTPGKPAAQLTDSDKGVAVATFDKNGNYFPTSSEKNSGIFNGTSTKDNFHLVDQWPKRTDSNGNVIREARPPGDRIISPNGAHPSDNSHDYYVIIVPR